MARLVIFFSISATSFAHSVLSFIIASSRPVLNRPAEKARRRSLFGESRRALFMPGRNGQPFLRSQSSATAQKAAAPLCITSSLKVTLGL